MVSVPVVAHQSRGQEFAAEVVLLGRGERVMDEERITYGFVDHTIEDVREQFTLSKQHGQLAHLARKCGRFSDMGQLTTRFPLLRSASRAKFDLYSSVYTRRISRR